MRVYCALCEHGSEHVVEQLMKKSHNNIKTLIPMRKIGEKRQGVWGVFERYVFRGYVFIYSEIEIGIALKDELRSGGTMLPMTAMCYKITNIIIELADSLNITDMQAIELFYNTNTYKELISQQTYLWTESSSFIADESLRELGLYKKQ